MLEIEPGICLRCRSERYVASSVVISRASFAEKGIDKKTTTHANSAVQAPYCYFNSSFCKNFTQD